MNFKDNKYSFFIIIGVWLLGLYCGISISKLGFFILDREVSIVDLLSLLVTIFIAVILNVKLNNQRNEKDLLIVSYQNIEKILYEIKTIVDSLEKPEDGVESIKATEIKMKLKHLSQMVSISSDNTIQYHSNNNIRLQIKIIGRNHILFWKYLTEDLGNKPKILRENFLLAEKVFYQYVSNVSKLILLINKD